MFMIERFFVSFPVFSLSSAILPFILIMFATKLVMFVLIAIETLALYVFDSPFYVFMGVID